MYTAITEEEIKKGVEVDFYLTPKDKAPTLKTTIERMGYDDRNRIVIKAEGIDYYFPFYFFAKSTSQMFYGCAITDPLDSLHASKGF